MVKVKLNLKKLLSQKNLTTTVIATETATEIATETAMKVNVQITSNRDKIATKKINLKVNQRIHRRMSKLLSLKTIKVANQTINRVVTDAAAVEEEIVNLVKKFKMQHLLKM